MDTKRSSEGIPVAALLVDPESMSVEWANDVALEWLGRSAGDVIGETVEDLIPIAQALGMYEDMRAVAETGEPRHATSFVMGGGAPSQRYSGSMYMLPNGYLLVMALFGEG